MFELDPKLAGDTEPVADLGLCTVRLMNDARFPWLILVPRRVRVREIFELAAEDRLALVEEIATASRVLMRLYRPDKLNVGALGNIVAQLHLHVLARRRDDAAWPGPVWGTGPAVRYHAAELGAAVERLRQGFAADREAGNAAG